MTGSSYLKKSKPTKAYLEDNQIKIINSLQMFYFDYLDIDYAFGNSRYVKLTIPCIYGCIY